MFTTHINNIFKVHSTHVIASIVIFQIHTRKPFPFHKHELRGQRLHRCVYLKIPQVISNARHS